MPSNVPWKVSTTARRIGSEAESAAFSKRQAEDPEKRELIVQTIRAVTGTSLRLAYELGGELEPEEALSEDELVARFKQEFGAVEEAAPKEEES